MKQKISKFSEYYFGVKEVEEEKSSPSSKKETIIINGIEIPYVEVLPEPKLNLKAKVEKPIEIDDKVYHDPQAVFLNIMLVVFTIILFVVIGIAVYLGLQLLDII